MAIRAIPKVYSGVRFASTLEADWASNLDAMRMVWEYEPEGVVLGDGQYYRPDLYLPRLSTWVEVKGPHNERIDKPGKLAAACMHAPECPGASRCDCGFGPSYPWRLVVVTRPAERGRMKFHGAPCPESPEPHIVVAHCGVCQQYSFADLMGIWRCRRCANAGPVNVLEGKDIAFRQIEHKPGARRRAKRT